MYWFFPGKKYEKKYEKKDEKKNPRKNAKRPSASLNKSNTPPDKTVRNLRLIEHSVPLLTKWWVAFDVDHVIELYFYTHR